MRIGLAFAFGMVLFLAASAWAATETVLWSFNPLQGDAGFPSANALISDGSGNFYGSTTAGGTNGTGAFFKLSPNGNGGWNESVLHSFGPLGGTADGYYPFGHIARDKHGYVLTGEEVVKAKQWSSSRDPYLLETSVPGVFACGDVRLSPVKRVASAVGEGSMAIAFVHRYLANEGRA